MNADEIVMKLRYEALVRQWVLPDVTAALIESLQAQLDHEMKSANKWICAANDYRKEAERLKDINKAIESDIYNAEMNLEHITAQLAASQRRERAAVTEVCRRCPDGEIIDGVMHYPCNGCKWRGPQEAGEGEAE